MHKFEILPNVLEAVQRRRGRKHVFEDFEPSTAALIVVDMQNFFCAEGQLGALPVAREIVPNINRIAAAMRAAGGRVVWIKTTFSEKIARSWSTFFDYFNTPEMRAATIGGLTAGTEGHDLYGELDVLPEDLTVEKNRYSAFIQGASDLHDILKGIGVDTLLITGTVTTVCCESTARDAAMLNYKTIMVADGTAAASDVQHNVALSNLFGGFCDVLTTGKIVKRLESVAAHRARAAE